MLGVERDGAHKLVADLAGERESAKPRQPRGALGAASPGATEPQMIVRIVGLSLDGPLKGLSRRLVFFRDERRHALLEAGLGRRAGERGGRAGQRERDDANDGAGGAHRAVSSITATGLPSANGWPAGRRTRPPSASPSRISTRSGPRTPISTGVRRASEPASRVQT